MIAPLLSMRGIQKSFPGAYALKGIDLDVQSGEVHALVGENGAGKSTLMHILAGVHRPDSGSIFIDGAGTEIRNERHALHLGIAMVYQERSLFAQLSVAENIFANRQPANSLGFIRKDRLHRAATELLSAVGLNISPAARVESLPHAEQQMIEIAKALSIDAKLIIFDEPTAALTLAETRVLFGLIRKLRDKGVAVIYISHRLHEIFEIADRVTILKDGSYQGTFPTAMLSPDEIVSRMVGRDLADSPPDAHGDGESKPAVIEVRNLCAARVHDVSFAVSRGEIVGLAGLEGSGRTDLARAIFGMDTILSGEIAIDGVACRIRSPRDAIRCGLGYATEDRRELGLFLDMDITENIVAARLDLFGSWWLDSRKQQGVARDYAAKLRIAAASLGQRTRDLSGGNQQKVVLSRWLLLNPKVLIVNEPTRGIDVGGKAEVHELLRTLAREGKAVIMISSDLPEVLALSHRVLVMRRGRIVAGLPHSEATEEAIVGYASTGAKEAEWPVPQQ